MPLVGSPPCNQVNDGDLPAFAPIELDGNRLAGPGAVANDLREASRATLARVGLVQTSTTVSAPLRRTIT